MKCWVLFKLDDMRRIDWPDRLFWQWTAFSAGVVLLWFGWPLAGVRYYGLGVLALGFACLVVGVVVRPGPLGLLIALAALPLGVTPLATYLLLATI